MATTKGRRTQAASVAKTASKQGGAGKRSSSSRTSSGSRSTGKKTTASRAPSRKKPAKKTNPASAAMLGLFILFIGAVLLFSLLAPTNALAIVYLRGFVNGTFGKLGLPVTLMILLLGLQIGLSSRWPLPKVVWVQVALILICVATILQAFQLDNMMRALRVEGYIENYNGFLWKSYEASKNVTVGGGSMGALLSYPMVKYLDVLGTVLVMFFAIAAVGFWLIRTLLPQFGDRISGWLGGLRADMDVRKEERAARRESEREILEAKEREAYERKQQEARDKALLVQVPQELAAGGEDQPQPTVEQASFFQRMGKGIRSAVTLPPEAGGPPPRQTEYQPPVSVTKNSATRTQPSTGATKPQVDWNITKPKKLEVEWPTIPSEPELDWQPDPAWTPEGEEFQEEPAWQPPEQEAPPPQSPQAPDVPAWMRSGQRTPAQPAPPAAAERPATPPMGAPKRKLYIENSPTANVPRSGPAPGEDHPFTAGPARSDPDAMPEYVVKRREKLDEEFGYPELYEQTDPETDGDPWDGIAFESFDDEIDSEWSPEQETAYAPMTSEATWVPVRGMPDEDRVISNQLPADMPGLDPDIPARPAAAYTPVNHLDRQPQLDPAERLDRPDWKLPEEAAPEPDVPEVEPYRQPPVDLLVRDESRMRVDTRDADANSAHKLEETLKSFGVTARVIRVVHGPAITRFELQPAPGVKVSKITGLTDDIALNMAALGVRIEAPIPGKAAVGIEIANTETQTVHLREVIESDEFQRNGSKLAVALGKDIAGKAIIADLARMPHLLIAGQTGSGKSVCINTIITSIMYRATPDEVRMILIDPKKVELAAYNGIPHLLVPVVTDPKKASGALNWAVMEMDERYKLFAEVGVRDIKGYNNSRPADAPLMPQIVVVIDELSDLMLVAPGEVEDAICRLAQLARACGIHLVVATQRPSVNVITGIIKANIPSRIAFEVSSQVDSRTILDSAGAEKLLGKGDMLFAPSGGGKPTRVQGCFVSDDEVGRVVDYVKSGNLEVDYNQGIIDALDSVEDTAAAAEAQEDDAGDVLFEQAVEMAIEAGQTSISMLQRRLRIGYARAGRLVDEMARKGIIGQADGAKPREVLMSREEFNVVYKRD